MPQGWSASGRTSNAPIRGDRLNQERDAAWRIARGVLDLAAAFILRGDLQLGNAIMTAHGPSLHFAATRQFGAFGTKQTWFGAGTESIGRE